MKRTRVAIALATAIITAFAAAGAGAGPIGKHRHSPPPSPPPSGAPPCGVETIVLDLAPPLKHKKHRPGQQLVSGNESIRLVFVNEHHGKHHHDLLPPPPPVVVTVPCTNDGAPGGTGAGGIDGADETSDGTPDGDGAPDGGGAGGTSGAPGGTNSGTDDVVVDLGGTGPGEPDFGAPDLGGPDSGTPDLGTGTDETIDGFIFVADTFDSGFTSVTDTGDVSGQVPEPSTLALLGLGLVGSARRRSLS